MKKITITLNDYIYEKIKDIKNKSQFINNLILIGLEQYTTDRDDLIKKLIEAKNKIIELENELKKLKSEELSGKKWRCFVCGYINVEQRDRCVSCNMPTRDTKKTEWIEDD